MHPLKQVHSHSFPSVEADFCLQIHSFTVPTADWLNADLKFFIVKNAAIESVWRLEVEILEYRLNFANVTYLAPTAATSNSF